MAVVEVPVADAIEHRRAVGRIGIDFDQLLRRDVAAVHQQQLVIRDVLDDIEVDADRLQNLLRFLHAPEPAQRHVGPVRSRDEAIGILCELETAAVRA